MPVSAPLLGDNDTDSVQVLLTKSGPVRDVSAHLAHAPDLAKEKSSISTVEVDDTPVAPLILAQKSQPVGVPFRTLALIVFILAFGVALAIYLLLTLNAISLSERNTSFSARVRALDSTLELALAVETETVKGLASLFQTLLPITYSQYLVYTRHATRELPFIQGLGWNPRVKHADRAAVELHGNILYNRTLNATAPLTITHSFNGTMQPIPPAPDYVPVLYMDPVEGNIPAILFDLLSDPVRAETVNKTTHEAEDGATSRLLLVQAAASGFGFLHMAPVYNSTFDPSGTLLNVSERVRLHMGMAVGVIRIEQLTQRALAGSSDITAIYDVTVPTMPMAILYKKGLQMATPATDIMVLEQRSDSPMPPPHPYLTLPAEGRLLDDHVYVNNLVFAQRRWQVVVVNGQAKEFSAVAIGVFVLVISCAILLSIMIYQKHRVQVALTESHANANQIDILYRSASVGMSYVDKSGTITRINDTMARLASGCDDFDSQLNTEKLFKEHLSQDIREVLMTGKPVTKERLVTLPSRRFVRIRNGSSGIVDYNESRDGIEMVSSTSTPTINEPNVQATFIIDFFPVFHNKSDASPCGVSVVMQDVTVIAQQRKDAEMMSMTKSLFLARMSHEIRTPINGILGNVEILLADSEQRPLSPAQRACMLDVRQCTKLLMSLLGDILDVSKMEAEKLPLELCPHVLLDVISSSVDMCNVRPGVELALHVNMRSLVSTVRGATQKARHSASPIDQQQAEAALIRTAMTGAVMMDSTRVSQIIFNLVNNAIKFTTSGSVHVLVDIVDVVPGQKYTYCVSVRDTGPGVAPDRIQSIFYPFMQEDASTSRKFGGTGLGLAIVRGLVDVMGGELFVRSSLGKGSVFTFTLTLDAAPAERPHDIEWVSCDVSFASRLNVLLATPYRETARSLREGLVSLGVNSALIASTIPEMHEALAQHTGVNCVVLEAELALALARAEEERVANGSNGLLSVSSMPSSDASKEAFSHMFGPDTVIAVHTSNRQHIAELCALGCHFVSSKPSDLTSVLFLYRVLPSLLDSRRNTGAAPTINTHGSAMSNPSPNAYRTERTKQTTFVSPTVDDAATLPHFLLVEDNLVNQRVFVAAMHRVCNCVIVVADNGQLGIQQYKSNVRFLTIFMDCQMPVMDGYEATAAIRKLEGETNSERVRIVALTAHAMVSDRELCISCGMDDYLTKPLELSELQRVVESVGVPLLDMNEKKKKKKKKKKAVNGDSHTDGPEGAGTAGDVKLTLQNDTDLDLDVPHTTTSCAYADVVQLSVPGQRSPSQVSMESLEETML